MFTLAEKSVVCIIIDELNEQTFVSVIPKFGPIRFLDHKCDN